MTDEVAFASAKKLASLIRRRKIGCVEYSIVIWNESRA